MDRRWERRHQEVLDLANDYGLKNVIHVPEHRRNGKWACLASAYNTGIALARGRVIIFLQDYAYATPGFLQDHLAFHDGGHRRYVVCPFTYLEMPHLAWRPNFQDVPFDREQQMARGAHCTEWDAVLRGEALPEMYAFREGRFDPAWIEAINPVSKEYQDNRDFHLGQELPIGHLYFKNESILRELAWDLNGMDERLDRGKGPIDIDFQLRLNASGIKTFWNPQGRSFCLNPRWICRTMPWGKRDERLEGRWSWNDGLWYNSLREIEMGKGGTPYAKNPFNMRYLSMAMEGWRHDPVIDVAGLDLPDRTYWGSEVWPNSP